MSEYNDFAVAWSAFGSFLLAFVTFLETPIVHSLGTKLIALSFLVASMSLFYGAFE